MIHTWSVKLSQYLGRELNLDNQGIPIVSYGLEVLIGGLLKLLVFILVPLILGVFREFGAAYLASAFLRVPSGGAHCSAYYKCLVVTLLIFLGLAAAAKQLSYYQTQIIYLFWFSIVFAFLIHAKLAPVDVKEKPIYSATRRKHLKYVSCLIIAIYCAIFLWWNPNIEIALSWSLGLLFHTITLTRPGQTFIKQIEGFI